MELKTINTIKMNNTMKKFTYFLFSLILLFTIVNVQAQDEEEKKKSKPQRKAFESAVLIDNQSDVVNSSQTLEWNIQHRFGTIENGSSDLWGMFAASNIRLGFSYTPIDRLAVGFGLSKIAVTNPYIDLNVKYKILEQTRENEMPVNLTFYGNGAIDTRDKKNFDEGVHRLSYFSELILSRRISKKFSVQGAFMMSHFNAVDSLFSNDIFAIGIGARYKVSSQGSILLEWTQPLSQHDVNDSGHPEGVQKDAGPYPNIAIAFEVATSAHAFQISFGVYRGLLQQYNVTYNKNQASDSKFSIGFNMTRLWGF